MVQTPLAFDFSKTSTICDAFDDAWAFLQARGSDFMEASNSLATRTILAKRIIEMADHGLTDVRKLRDDALAFLQHNASRSFRFGMSFSALAPSRIFRASDPSPPTALTYATISSSSRTA
jgi:hypothetical protein